MTIETSVKNKFEEIDSDQYDHVQLKRSKINDYFSTQVSNKKYFLLINIKITS